MALVSLVDATTPAPSARHDPSERRLTDFGHEAGMADWAPDGRRLAFVSQKPDSPGVLTTWILGFDADRGTLTSARPLTLPDGVSGTETIAWSPDGTSLAIEASTDPERPGARTLWIVPVDGGQARRVLDYQSVTFGGVDWSPDGRALIYGALVGERMQVFAADVRTGEARQLTSDPAASLFLPQVSPDGRWIAATATRHVRRVVSVRLDGPRIALALGDDDRCRE